MCDTTLPELEKFGSFNYQYEHVTKNGTTSDSILSLTCLVKRVLIGTTQSYRKIENKITHHRFLSLIKRTQLFTVWVNLSGPQFNIKHIKTTNEDQNDLNQLY